LTKNDIQNLVIAYEPVWAIGTGKTATPEEAARAHAFCRNMIGSLFNKEIAAQIPLLYGGSVKSDNIVALLHQTEIQGALVGGASLDPKEFVKLVELSKSVV
ncbi:MAG: triose-phosphate isomerase, partial [Chlamydiota bacterium]